GGGIPGLVVAVARPTLTMALLDATAKRCRFLEEAVATLGLADRVRVVEDRAEVAGRGPLRGTAEVVLARSFGAPATTAECAAPLLAVGGRLLVSEPPEPDDDRWPPGPLRTLGLVPRERTGRPAVQVLFQEAPCPGTYPRRDGIPAKRPLF
ncbi:MAG TPA: RsmG family class I SAM-dependent methyltransferase, partial [Acidimicrobiales bacterium]|nr:RsmG family class I SAM-dependent methyltransferase [Acidimicrobiales bacterium]